MKLEVLLSCMNQSEEIIHKSGLDNVSTLVIDQCGTAADELVAVNDRHRILRTGSRGLSVSRNLAISMTEGEICLLADDDEIFVEDLEERICRAYETCPKADVIIFQLTNYKEPLTETPRKLRGAELLRVSSVQISFRLASIQKSGITFDPLLGAGTPSGSGEETKFMLDCFRHGLSIWTVPVFIGTLEEVGSSTWFHGYDEAYFYRRGMLSRYLFGLPVALLYAGYFLLTKQSLYRKDLAPTKAARHFLAGIMRNELDKASCQQRRGI